MKTIVLPQTEPWQKAVIDDYIEHPTGKWFVVKAVRQCGKSVMMQILLVIASFREAFSVSLSISPVMSQSRKMFEDISRFAAPLIKKANASLLEITFINDSKIIFKSGEQGDSIRGETCKHSGILCVDEAAYQNDEVFYNILVPTTNVFNNDIFIVSTPRFKDGFFYNLFVGDNEKVLSYDWTDYDTSKYLSAETLEIYRRELPKNSFLAEFCGEFISGDGQVFTDFKECVRKSSLVPSEPIVIGIDWGSGAGKDYTVLTYGQFIKDHVIITKQDAFNDKAPMDTVRYITNQVEQLVHQGFRDINICVESNSIGTIYYSALVEEIDAFEMRYNDSVSWQNEISITVSKFTTTNASKKRVIEQLEVMFDRRVIYIPDDSELLNQLSLFEAKVNKETGNIQYAVFVPGKHDDRVMSLVITTQRLHKEL